MKSIWFWRQSFWRFAAAALSATRQNKEVDRGTGRIPGAIPKYYYCGTSRRTKRTVWTRNQSREFGLSLAEYKSTGRTIWRYDKDVAGKELRDLRRVATAQMRKQSRIAGNRRDSVVYLPGDTVTTILRCVDIVEQMVWVARMSPRPDGQFTGTYKPEDSLVIVETLQYKRFWGFLWKTKR